MTSEMNWQEKMMQANEDLDAMEQQGGLSNEDEAKAKDSSNASQSTVQTEKTATTDGLVDLASMIPEDKAQTATTLSGEADSLRERIRELEAELQRNKSENGRAHALSEKLRLAEAENETLRDRLNEASRVQPFDGRVDEFTQDECDLMSDEMRQAIGSRFAKLQKDNQDLMEEQRKIVAQLQRATKMADDSERMAMQKQLAVRFPNLNTIAGSDAWRTFCSETDPITRQQQGALFKDAVSRCDVEAVSAIIRHFLSVSGMNDGRMSVGYKPEEHFTSNGTPAFATTNKTYSLREVKAFLNGVYSGRIQLNTPERERMYREYSAAMDEGRLDP